METESGKVIISALVDTRGNKIKEYNAGVDVCRCFFSTVVVLR